jgi:hypothetical protein
VTLLALLLAASPAPLVLEVFVPLCDSALIACGTGPAGDPDSLTGNLYWGAAFGAEHFLSRAPGFKVKARTDAPRPGVLRELVLTRAPKARERAVELRLFAYSGREIDRALADFLRAASGESTADLVVWAGHDRLMDVAPPPVEPRTPGKPVAVLACSSKDFFGPVLGALHAKPLLLTRTFMAPEAYLLEAVAASVARHGLTPGPMREAAIAAYARYQKISVKAAGTVFAN